MAVKIRVKYFGMVAAVLGKGQEEINLPAAELDLRVHFATLYPALSDMTWKIAVDQEIVEGTVALRNDAEVVLLPPFAGG